MSRDSYTHRLRRGAPRRPILFAFHGTGGDENQFFDFAAELLPEATIVAPRGEVSEGGALRFFRRTGEGVYDMDDLARRAKTMAGFVAAHAAEAEAGAVLGLGYSNGANILAAMMLAGETSFDAAMLMHPLIPWAPAEQPGLARRDIVITAGRLDPICPAPLTEALAAYLKRQGATVDLVWHEGGHEMRANELDAARRFAERFA